MRTGWKGSRPIGWRLSHFEPPKSPTPIELFFFQVGVPTCFLILVLWVRLDVASANGMAGNHAEPCRTMQNHAEPCRTMQICGGDFRT